MTFLPDAPADVGAELRLAYQPPSGVPNSTGDALGTASEARLQRELEAMSEVVPSSVRVFDADGRLLRLNLAARAEHADAVRPMSLRELWERDQPLRAAPAGRGSDVRVSLADHPGSRALRGESVRAETYVVRRGTEGDRRVVESYAGPVRDVDGRIIGAVLVDRDATERARLARALEEQVRRTMELNERVLNEAATLEKMVEARSRELLDLQESRARERRLAAVGQLAAGVMHDVNNALNPIMAAAFLLQRRADDPDAVRDYAARIHKAAETCAASAARVGRFIRQDPPAEGRDVGLDLSTLAEEVLAMSSAAWAEGLHGVQVQLEARLAEGVTARGLPGEIREALLNLVKNAVDAMPGGGRLTVSTGIDGRGARREGWVAVTDTGMGMSDEVRDRAFEPFFSTKGAGGSGLGLAEVYGIMKRHRGRAEIESTVGVGTTVRLVFPFASAADEPEDVLAPVRSVPRRVLVVEDNEEGRDFMRALLEAEGHAVDVAGSLGEARTRLAEPGPDGGAPVEVLVTDLGLPDGSGWELVQEVRDRWPGLPIAVVTGWEPQIHGRVSPDLVLRKPLRAEELLGFVARQPAEADVPAGTGATP